MSESFLSLLRDVRRARKQGSEALAQRQRTRLAEMVAFARTHSPYYRELYQDLPERVADVSMLPVTSKPALMARFDDWATDRAVTIEQARAFVDDPTMIGEQFLGKYTITTTSGTTGLRGIFVQDDRVLTLASAITLHSLVSWLTIRDLIRIVAGRVHVAMVIATGGHFASTVAAARLRKRNRLRQRVIQPFPVQTPLPTLVEQLNRFQPVILAPYASVAKLLAGEQEVGRLRINPVLLTVAAEGLAEDDYDRIARTFNAQVRSGYAANECPFLSYSCEQQWFHVNSDWVVFEPVDADYRPVPPGTQSHTVLLSNLANRIQPILRYDLGDSILERPDPCPCGSPLPAIRVQGRAADVLVFPDEHDASIRIAPLVFGTALDRIPGIELFQIVQITPTHLRVRMLFAAGVHPDRVWERVETEISGVLRTHQLDHVTVERAEEPPQQTPGGKYREIIPLK